MIFAIDFDGTIVKNRFPKIGEVVPASGKPYVDWLLIQSMLIKKGLLVKK